MADGITNIRALERGEIEVLEEEKAALLAFLRSYYGQDVKAEHIAKMFIGDIIHTENSLKKLEKSYEELVKLHERMLGG